jgi:hypothetical protein
MYDAAHLNIAYSKFYVANTMYYMGENLPGAIRLARESYAIHAKLSTPNVINNGQCLLLKLYYNIAPPSGIMINLPQYVSHKKYTIPADDMIEAVLSDETKEKLAAWSKEMDDLSSYSNPQRLLLLQALNLAALSVWMNKEEEKEVQDLHHFATTHTQVLADAPDKCPQCFVDLTVVRKYIEILDKADKVSHATCIEKLNGLVKKETKWEASIAG